MLRQFRREFLKYPQRLKFYVAFEGVGNVGLIMPEEVVEMQNHGPYLEVKGASNQWYEFDMNGKCRCSPACRVVLVVEWAKVYKERRIID